MWTKGISGPDTLITVFTFHPTEHYVILLRLRVSQNLFKILKWAIRDIEKEYYKVKLTNLPSVKVFLSIGFEKQKENAISAKCEWKNNSIYL